MNGITVNQLIARLQSIVAEDPKYGEQKVLAAVRRYVPDKRTTSGKRLTVVYGEVIHGSSGSLTLNDARYTELGCEERGI